MMGTKDRKKLYIAGAKRELGAAKKIRMPQIAS